jgi:hypothetical protein
VYSVHPAIRSAFSVLTTKIIDAAVQQQFGLHACTLLQFQYFCIDRARAFFSINWFVLLHHLQYVALFCR